MGSSMSALILYPYHEIKYANQLIWTGYISKSNPLSFPKIVDIKKILQFKLTFFLPLLGAETVVVVVLLTWSAGRDSGTGCNVGVLMLWG